MALRHVRNLFGRSRGNKTAAIEIATKQNLNLDTSNFSDEEWSKLYDSYLRAHEANGIPVNDSEDEFRRSVEENVSSVQRISEGMRRLNLTRGGKER